MKNGCRSEIRTLLHDTYVVRCSCACTKHGNRSQCCLQVYRTAADLAARGGVGVGSVLGPEAVKCALLELYGVPQSKKRPAEKGRKSCY